MNEVLKQRLVGALILLALGVIFWPIIFVQPGGEEIVQREGIPPQPGVSTAPVEAPDPAGLRTSPRAEIEREKPRPETPPPAPASQSPDPVPDTEAAPEPEPEPEPDPETPPVRDVAPQPLELDADGVPVAWILQVASVSSAEKAESLRAELLQLDNKAYVEKVTRDGRALYRVYIGPKFERARLESIQGSVDKTFGVQSMIRRYVP